jgi:hypothetical protein
MLSRPATSLVKGLVQAGRESMPPGALLSHLPYLI